MILAPKKFRIKRERESGSWQYGKWVPTTEINHFFITGSLQPLGQREVEMLPEAARTKARFSLYCEITEPFLKTTDLEETKGADRLIWDKEEYMLFGIGDWQLHLTGVTHKAYVLIEIGDDE